jgi:hypothetical protein
MIIPDIQTGYNRNYFSNINVPPNLELVLDNSGGTVVPNDIPKKCRRWYRYLL